MTDMLEGRCHCGAAGWTLVGDPEWVLACNCTLCRRYGAIWAYDYEGERVSASGPLRSYVRADEPEPTLANLFCPTCANVVAWRGLAVDDEGRRRMAVNVRLAPPEAVAALPVKHFDGLHSWAGVPGMAACVRDLWF